MMTFQTSFKGIFVVLVVLFFGSKADAQITCNNWLYIPNSQSYVTVGDLDVPGTSITVEGLFSRDNDLTPEGYASLNVVSKHWTPADVNYLLRVDRAQVTTTNGHHMTPDICELENKRIYHVAMTYDGAMLKFYRNGFLMSQIPCTGDMFQSDLLTTIGATAGSPTTNTQLIGFLNEIRIWNVVKTQAQLQAAMNGPLPNPTSQPGLLAYYTFDNLQNKQGNAAWNATLHGAASIGNSIANCSLVPDSCFVPTPPNSISDIINTYTPLLAIDPCSNQLTVEDATTFNIGDTVLLIQMKGAVIDSSNSASFGAITNYRHAGNYEFNYVKSKAGNTIELQNVMLRQYDIQNGRVQLIRVPYFKEAVVTNTLTCLPWDGTKGGVLALNVENSLTLNAPIDVGGKGFRGGRSKNTFYQNLSCAVNGYSYPENTKESAAKGEGIYENGSGIAYGKGALANGGGGGNGHNSGGGGGGNLGNGGFGGYQLQSCGNAPFDNRGVGGKMLVNNDRIFLGGGGGSGHTDNLNGIDMNGGNGGGIAIIMANNIVPNNFKIIASGVEAQICNDGSNNCHDGSGGGGAGGSVLINCNDVTGGSLFVEANGGKGGDIVVFNNVNAGRIGPGGGGGGGLVATTNAALHPNIAPFVSGGVSGTIIEDGNNSWGAENGNVGGLKTNVVSPFATIPFQPNIESVSIKDSLSACATYDFDGLVVVNRDSIQSWQWSFGDGVNSSVANPSHLYPGSGNYEVKLEVTDINGCKDSASKMITVTIPSLSVSNDTFVCSGQHVQLFAFGADSLSWSPSAGLNDSAVFNPIASPSVTTTYIVTGKTNSCIDTDSITVSVIPRPAISTSNDTNICRGKSVQLRASGADSYFWSPGGLLNDSTFTNPIASPTSTTTFVVTGTRNGCSAVDSITVSIIPFSLVGVSNDTAICRGQNVQLVASGADTYSWSPSVALSDSTAFNPLASPSTTTTFVVTGTRNGCSAVDSITVGIIPLPQVGVSNDTTICRGQNVRLVASGADTFTWSPGLLLSDSTVFNPLASPNNNTTFFVKGTRSGCSAIDSVTVTTKPIPTILVSNDTAVCKGQSLQLFASGADSYSWSPGAGLSDSSDFNPTASPIGTTTFVVTGTSNGCSAVDSITVSINPLPLVRVSNDTAICRGQSVQLVASGADTFSWSPGLSLSDSTAFNPLALPNNSTTFVVTGKRNGCSAMDSVTVTTKSIPTISVSNDTAVCKGQNVQLLASGAASFTWSPGESLNDSTIFNPIATASVGVTMVLKGTTNGCSVLDSVKISILPAPTITLSNDTSICPSSTIQLFAAGADSYEWFPASTLTNPTSSNPMASPNDSTTYYVIAKNTLLSCTTTDSVKITFTKFDNFSVSPSVAVCHKSPSTLEAKGGSTYQWTPAASLNNAAINNPIALPDTTTTYTVIITETTCGIKDTLTTVVTVKPLPPVKAQKSNDITCAILNSQLTGSGANKYIWTPFVQISANNIANPIAFPNTTQQYTVTGTDTLTGCSAKDTITVQVSKGGAPQIFAPKAFSPNGDGLNDCFRIKTADNALLKDIELAIYNRWGNRVFYTRNPSMDCWDGTYKGAKLETANFVYYIKFANSCANKMIYGNVLLIR